MTDVGQVECIVFSRNNGKQFDREGEGVHRFGRIPMVGEYVSLNQEDEFFYLVRQVVHTGYGSHQAEIYVVKDEQTKSGIGEPFPPV